MAKFKKTGAIVAAIVGAAVASTMTPGALAGTGGSDHSGILFGESPKYCDAALTTLNKIDSSSEQALSEAKFTIAANEGGVAVKGYTAQQVQEGKVDEDKAIWVEAFNKAIDTAFSQSEFGKKYLAAQIKMSEVDVLNAPVEDPTYTGPADAENPEQKLDTDGNPGQRNSQVDQAGKNDQAGVWVEGAKYVPSEELVFPADITNIPNEVAQSSAMNTWVKLETKPTVEKPVLDTEGNPVIDPNTGEATTEIVYGTSSITDYYNQIKGHLDAIGVVLYENYDPANLTDPATASDTVIAGTSSEDIVSAEYAKSYKGINFIIDAVKAAGYLDAAIGADGALIVGTISEEATAQDWTAFVTAYQGMIAEDSYSFGITPPTYDLVARVVGNDAVASANTTANAAITATSSIDMISDNSGEIYYATFGRSNTEGILPGDDGILGTDDDVWNSPETECSHLNVEITETEAPKGYKLPEVPTLESTPGNDARAGIAIPEVTETVTNEIDIPGASPETPESPKFESGI